MNIYEKLLAIQGELKAPKSQYNSFGEYKYRSTEDILEAVKPLLQEHKATLTIADNVELIGERYYIKSTITLIDVEKPVEQIEVSALAREEETKKKMDSSQITGASSSYARKYALNGLFAIDDNKDSDNTNVGQNVPKKQTVQQRQTTANQQGAINRANKNNTNKVPNKQEAQQTDEQKRIISELAKNHLHELTNILKSVNVNDTNLMNETQANWVIDKTTAMIVKQGGIVPCLKG